MNTPILKCIACKKEVINYENTPLSDLLVPESAIAFSGSGNYGSIYDLSKTLIIILCDSCITSSIEEGSVLIEEVERPVRPKTNYIQAKSPEEAHDLNRRW